MMIEMKLSLIVKNKKKIKRRHALHKKTWFKGNIEKYNQNICKYHVSFNDGSGDYIGEDDIDMIKAIVLQQL